MADTKIEWATKVWNPVTGCSKVSQGCKNCYAERIFGRNLPEMKGQKFTDVVCHPERLEIPLHWRKPQRVFVNSMSDMFHPNAPFEFINKVFAVMSHCPRHTFLVLTKRPARMLEYIQKAKVVSSGFTEAAVSMVHTLPGKYMDEIAARQFTAGTVWPLPNVWLGVSVEDQQTANDRIPLLLQTPAAGRFISAEPLLGAIDLTSGFRVREGVKQDALYGTDGLRWVICGGESGPNARPMHPDWARSLRDQCQAAGVPFFFKQWGEWAVASFENGHFDQDMARNNAVWVAMDGTTHKPSSLGLDNPVGMFKAGKAKAGRLLDGREWNEFPTTTQN